MLTIFWFHTLANSEEVDKYVDLQADWCSKIFWLSKTTQTVESIAFAAAARTKENNCMWQVFHCGSLWVTEVNLWMFGSKYSFGSFLLVNGGIVDVEAQGTIFLCSDDSKRHSITWFGLKVAALSHKIVQLGLTKWAHPLVNDYFPGYYEAEDLSCFKGCCLIPRYLFFLLPQGSTWK